MRNKATYEIESGSKALQIFICITLLITVISMVFTLKDIMKDVNSENFWDERTTWVFNCLFYIIIQVFAIMTFRSIAKNKTPFLPEVAKNIKIIGVLIMFSNALSQWIPGMISFITNDGVFTLIDGPILLGVLLGMIFCCLGSIFDYGCVLQRQDDEML